MRTTLRATLIALAALAVAVTTSCGGGTSKTDEGKPDVGIDVPLEVVTDLGVDPGPDDQTIRDVPDADVEPTEGVVGDADVPDEDVPDVGPQNCDTLRGFLCPCEYNDDCLTGLCIDTVESRVCSKQCGVDVACPDGWTCEKSTVGGENLFYCIYPFPNLCRPCIADQDCLPPGGGGNKRFLCMESNDSSLGSFCGGPCERSTDCPNVKGQAFECVPVLRGGVEVKQCRPTVGECPCTTKYQEKGYTTNCSIKNEFGTCSATRTCDVACPAKTPLVEACNNKDDDCSGTADDNVPSVPCDITNEFGTCKGTSRCIAGNEDCQGTAAKGDSPAYGIGACNGKDDDCDGVTDQGFPDLDSDGIADCVDPDRDGDGIQNGVDNCPDLANSDQADNDGDKIGDACDTDDDNDGVLDGVDNCVFVANFNQANADGDKDGDACDCDADNDTVPNAADLDMKGGKCPDPGAAKDNCPLVANTDQLDTNGDKVGDACDCDIDSDGVANNNPGCVAVDKPDNCRTVANRDQVDTDLDLIGDACDCDMDNDGVANNNPTCPLVSVVDNCLMIKNEDQADTDLDKTGDACDCDIDNDGVTNPNPGCLPCSPCDNCPYTPNPDQTNTFGGEFGDACNKDWDRDGVLNDDDNCPRTPNTNQSDLDLDGLGDACDCDVDGDGVGNDGPDVTGGTCPVPEPLDNCARIANVDQADQDGDRIGDACDCDIDGDGDPQPNFECPTPALPDCEPFNPEVSHLAVEKCGNGIDDNCNGLTDEENAQACTTYYFDKDNDGYGTAQSKCLCSPSGSYRALSSGDCNDDERTINPGVQEICDNGRDDNCNSSENDLNALNCTKFFFDNDGDLYGTGDFECRCFSAGGKFTARQTGDCDDANPLVNPGRAEICNDGIDNDCTGSQNDENAQNCRWFYYDGDSDTYGTSDSKCYCFANDQTKFSATRAGDCNDTDAAVNPGMAEVCSNGKDDNCDGLQDTQGAQGCLTYYYDGDKDSYGITNDNRCLCAPAAPYSTRDAGDCQDANANINPGAAEVCDGIDNNCDTRADENPDTLCPGLPNASSTCQGSQCVVKDCAGGWFNVNSVVADGCECAQDGNDYTGNTCAEAISLGEALDNGNALPLVTGRIVPGLDEDWYYVAARDQADFGGVGGTGGDKFNLVAKLLAPTNGTIKIEVRKGGCNATPACAAGGTTYQWSEANEAGCFTPPTGAPGQLWTCCAPGQCEAGGVEVACCNNTSQCADATHNRRHCLDDSSLFYIRVYRDMAYGNPTRCTDTDYTLEVSNGK